MSSTIALQDSIDWATTFFRGDVISKTNFLNQPALTNANVILQTIVGPPFCWRWNRKEVTFVTIAGTQDYAQTISDFGFMEKVSLNLPTVPVTGAFEIPNIRNILGVGNERGRPDFIAAQLDNNSGSITFRFLPIPDQVYSITVTYQKKPALMVGPASSWSPIPDEYAYIFQRGFLALSLGNQMDERAQDENRKFVGALLGASEGLSEMQKNLFMTNWNIAPLQAQNEAIRSQQGNQARSQ